VLLQELHGQSGRCEKGAARPWAMLRQTHSVREHGLGTKPALSPVLAGVALRVLLAACLPELGPPRGLLVR